MSAINEQNHVIFIVLIAIGKVEILLIKGSVRPVVFKEPHPAVFSAQTESGDAIRIQVNIQRGCNDINTGNLGFSAPAVRWVPYRFINGKCYNFIAIGIL